MVSWAAPTLRRTTFFFFWNHFERTPAEFERTKKYAEYAGGEALDNRRIHVGVVKLKKWEAPVIKCITTAVIDLAKIITRTQIKIVFESSSFSFESSSGRASNRNNE